MNPNPHLDQQRELLDAEGARGGEGVEGEVDGGAAAGVPAAPQPGSGPLLGAATDAWPL